MTCDCLCKFTLKKPRNLFYVLGRKEIYCTFNTCSIISVVFFTNAVCFVVLSFSLHEPCAKIQISIQSFKGEISLDFVVNLAFN